MSKQVSNYQQSNSALDTIGKMKEPALIATIALGVAYVGKIAIEAIRDSLK
jgi:hypothetical protein